VSNTARQQTGRQTQGLIMTIRRLSLALLLAVCGALVSEASTAEVRFGKNVRIGGHDVSNQTFNSKRRGEFYIYNSTPRNPGCRWRSNRDGSRTKVCHLKRKRR
jgi:hypothetical protein